MIFGVFSCLLRKTRFCKKIAFRLDRSDKIQGSKHEKSTKKPRSSFQILRLKKIAKNTYKDGVWEGVWEPPGSYFGRVWEGLGHLLAALGPSLGHSSTSLGHLLGLLDAS